MRLGWFCTERFGPNRDIDLLIFSNDKLDLVIQFFGGLYRTITPSVFLVYHLPSTRIHGPVPGLVIVPCTAFLDVVFIGL
ncbi:hypothetical protein SAMN06269250_1324 [Spirosoma fluviale]|uniref:Nucleotidyltransferase domain-containing protein n=1 Tax=Spirosoma fluviale TaxID=1597977 RepID=A0A286FAQ9_9BACT|nr:hypothetical protein SAMN06269250_1324 [Spirosoma fluviale]